MIPLSSILDVELLSQHLTNGVVRKQTHPLYPELTIYNYTEVAQCDRVWDEVTNQCRGLITVTKEGGEQFLLARGFNKFHNLNTDYIPETQEENLHKETPLSTEKLDGSMGIVFFYDELVHVATRGSFDSDQARWATAWLRAHEKGIGSFLNLFSSDFTPVCEVIYPENRIVVEYETEGLIFLAGIRHNGSEISRNSLELWCETNKLPVVKKFDKSLAECAAEDNPNEEGYVLTYSNGLKVKVKFPAYVRLHRIVTGLNPKTVWEMLSTGQGEVLNTLIADTKMPETFRVWLYNWMDVLLTEFSHILTKARIIVGLSPGHIVGDRDVTRKEHAEYFLLSENARYSGVCFAILDGKDLAPIIWKMIKPKATDTFKKDGE
jgi:RNA ligase